MFPSLKYAELARHKLSKRRRGKELAMFFT